MLWRLSGEIGELQQGEVLDRRLWASLYASKVQLSQVLVGSQDSLHAEMLCVSEMLKMTEWWWWVKLR